MPVTTASTTTRHTSRAARARNGRRGVARRKPRVQSAMSGPSYAATGSAATAANFSLSSDEDKENCPAVNLDLQAVRLDSDTSLSEDSSSLGLLSAEKRTRTAAAAAAEHFNDTSSSSCSEYMYDMTSSAAECDMTSSAAECDMTSSTAAAAELLVCEETLEEEECRVPMGDVTTRYTSNAVAASRSFAGAAVPCAYPAAAHNPCPTPPAADENCPRGGQPCNNQQQVSTPVMPGVGGGQGMHLALSRFPESDAPQGMPGNSFTPDTFAATKRFISSSPMTPTTSKLAKLSVGNLGASCCPLPAFNWGDSEACWAELVEEDDAQLRVTRHALARHSAVSPYHRSVVLEWLSEVTESYAMRNDTYYLAVNYFDRYLALAESMPPERLQLLGTTALFTASKFEEIYPPKSEVFAYVTDGLCHLSDVIKFEVALVHRLAWKLGPATPLTWLMLFLQLANHDNIPGRDDESRNDSNNFLVNHNFSNAIFMRATAIMDLAVLDYGYTQFSSRMIAAATLIHLDQSLVELFTFLNQSTLKMCFDWLAPFFLATNHKSVLTDVNESDKMKTVTHTHRATLTLLKDAQKMSQQRQATALEQSPPPASSQNCASNMVLTPPYAAAGNHSCSR